jgi:hypothetical protein
MDRWRSTADGNYDPALLFPGLSMSGFGHTLRSFTIPVGHSTSNANCPVGHHGTGGLKCERLVVGRRIHTGTQASANQKALVPH